MPSFNDVRLVGYTEQPAIIKQYDIYEEVQIILHTKRRWSSNVNGPRYEDIEVKYIIEKDKPDEMFNVLKNAIPHKNILDIMGNLVITAGIIKEDCQYCRKKMEIQLNCIPFVFPKAAWIIPSLQQPAENIESLLEENYSEISNRIVVMGNVCSEPTGEIRNSDYAKCKYCIAVNRHKYITTQRHIRTDYPYIYSYGEQAKRDLRYVKKNSLILVNGYIRSNQKKKVMECPHCRRKQEYAHTKIDIVPYEVEYLRNFEDTVPDITEITEHSKRHYELIEESLNNAS